MYPYLTHATHERARFRHPVLGREDKRQEAMEIFKQAQGVVGIKPGINSILIYFEPETELAAICAELEKALPELTAPDPVGKENGGKKKSAGHAAKAMNGRKLELKCLLGCGAATAGLALTGPHRWHALAGGLFTLFAIKHVWDRRGRI